MRRGPRPKPLQCRAMRRLTRLLPSLPVPAEARRSTRDVVRRITVALVLVPSPCVMRSSPACPRTTACTPRSFRSWSRPVGLLRAARHRTVAVESLLVAASLTPLAAQGTGLYVTLAITLAFGRLHAAGAACSGSASWSFLSHPVIAGSPAAHHHRAVPAPQAARRADVPPTGCLRSMSGRADAVSETHCPRWPSASARWRQSSRPALLPRWTGVLIPSPSRPPSAPAMGFEHSATVHPRAARRSRARALAMRVPRPRAHAGRASERRAKRASSRARTAASRREPRPTLGTKASSSGLRINERRSENRWSAAAAQPGGRQGRRHPWRIQSLDEKAPLPGRWRGRSA